MSSVPLRMGDKVIVLRQASHRNRKRSDHGNVVGIKMDKSSGMLICVQHVGRMSPIWWSIHNISLSP